MKNLFYCTHIIYFLSYLLSWFTTTINLEQKFEMDSNSFIFKTSKSSFSILSFIFFTLSNPWREYCKISHASFEVVASATFSNMPSSKHWWIRVKACWSFFLVFNKTFSFGGQSFFICGFCIPSVYNILNILRAKNSFH